MADDPNDDIEIQLADDGGADASPVTADTPKEISADEGIAELKAAREERAKAQREVAEERKARLEAEERYAQGMRDAQSRDAQTVDGHIHQLASTKESLGNRLALLKRDYAEAARAGDYDKLAEVQSEISQRNAEIVALNQGIWNLEQRKKQPKAAPDAVAKPSQANEPSAKSKQWIDDHRDVIKDPKMYAKMIAGHHDAVAEGIDIDSPEYFEHVERHMGLKKDAATEASVPRKVQTSAPVSRAAPSGSGSKETVHLTREMRETARALNMTDAEYAAGLRKMQKSGRISTSH